jgi:two-component system sensor histidine kinase BaeS
LELLIDDLLLLATEDRTVAHDEVALGPLLEDVALDLRSPAERNGTVLHVGGEIDVMLRGEESLLRRAFSNLIENAICYNRAGGEVEVSVGTEGGWAVIAISDNGIGIPLEDQPHIFERFYRVDRSRGQHPGGVGLGLAIVADVVRRHGGTIEVKSVASIGSTFTVRLPL